MEIRGWKFRGGNKCQLLSVLLLPTHQTGSDCSNSLQSSCWSCVGRGWQWQGCPFHGCWSWELPLAVLCRASSGAGPSRVDGGVTALRLWQLLELGREGTRHPGPGTSVLLQFQSQGQQSFSSIGKYFRLTDVLIKELSVLAALRTVSLWKFWLLLDGEICSRFTLQEQASVCRQCAENLQFELTCRDFDRFCSLWWGCLPTQILHRGHQAN